MDAVSYAHSAKQAQRIKKFIENPDSNSGVLTQPKVIEAGETVTIKSGRQAILADTVVDGDLVIEAGGDVFIPAGANFGDLETQISTKVDKDMSGYTSKSTPVDADLLSLSDSAATFGIKKLTWANLKASLVNYLSTETGFLISTGTNGYIKLPSWLGRFIIQWGQAVTDGTGHVIFTYPIAFPNSYFKHLPMYATSGRNPLVTNNGLGALSYCEAYVSTLAGASVTGAGVDFIVIGR